MKNILMYLIMLQYHEKEVLKVAASTIIRQLLTERGINIKTFAEMYGMNYQTMRNKLSRNTFTFEEMLKVAELLGCDVEFITKDTKKSFKVTKSEKNEE